MGHAQGHMAGNDEASIHTCVDCGSSVISLPWSFKVRATQGHCRVEVVQPRVNKNSDKCCRKRDILCFLLR